MKQIAVSEDSFDPTIGEVPAGWEFTTLGEVCKRGAGFVQTGPFGSQLHASDYVPMGIPSIMPINISEDYVNEEKLNYVSEADAARLKRHRVRPGDIVYSRRGDVERRALMMERHKGWLCGTGSLLVRVGEGVVDPRFAYYYLGHPSVRDWIVRNAVGSTMPNLNSSIMASVPFALPPLPEQRAIARILGTLDDKIELNRRMNQTLEAMAQSLFKSWFVDFDPVIAKIEGRRPYGMDAETAALFPDKLVETEIGPVPEAWKVSTIGSEVKVVGGSTPSTAEPKYWASGTINWITPRDLSKLVVPIVLSTERRITEEGLKQISSGLLPQGTVLMSSRAPIGYLAITEIPVAVNQGFIAMICNRNLTNHYVLLWAQENMEEILSRSGGTTFGEISKTNFRPIPVIVPPKEILDAYEQRASSLFSRLVLNLRETITLISARDTLLPKLLSGELRVKEAEKVADRAV